MPFTLSHGEKIHYHVEGDGQTIVLQHGGYGSMEDWYEYGYVDGLKDRFQLILIDARAHGRSAKPHDEAKYSPELHAADVVAVLDELDIEKCHFLGFSLGGRIGYWVARFHPERLRSLMVLEADPYRRERDRMVKAAETIEIWGPQLPNISEKHLARWLENDVRALVAAYSKSSTDFSDILPLLKIPCLIASGTGEGVFENAKRSAAEIKDVTFVLLDGFDHADVFVRSDVTLPHIIQFLTTLEQE
jgi:pimeloyl-ACP methyl ester carboxylesterase